MPRKDPVARKAYNQEYYQKNQPRLVAYRRQYVEDNYEELHTWTPERRENNRIKMIKFRRSKGILPKTPTPITCGHPDAEHYAFGLCTSCYRKLTYSSEKRKEQTQKRKDALGPEGYTEYLRVKTLRRMYKLSPEQYEAMYDNQDHRCCCGRELKPGKTTCVDHDHSCCSTNKTCGKCVRGLLCMRCNMVLGLLEEDPKLLPDHLRLYLEKYPKKNG